MPGSPLRTCSLLIIPSDPILKASGSSPARLLVPAIRASAEGDFDAAWPAVREALERGVGGFILFGGTREAVQRLTSRIHADSPHPLLVGSDLERGAGQQFADATILPPPMALAALDDLEATRACGRVTAEEALELGINWVLAPVADLDIEPENPIVSTRSFGSDPQVVARHVAAWVAGCQDAGALACVKHFPGHGRTTGDSHLERPTVDEPAESLHSTDLLPFSAAFSAGAASVMTAHVSYPALDAGGEAATHSAAILGGVLRSTMGVEGIVVSDAIGMAGLSGSMGEGEATIRALIAGCDVLLYPEDPAGVVDALHEAIASGRISSERVAASIVRIERALESSGAGGGFFRERVSQPPAEGRRGPSGSSERQELADGSALSSQPLAEGLGAPSESSGRQKWADGLALRSITVLRGDPAPGRGAEIVALDDDLGGPYSPPSRSTFDAAFRGARPAPPEFGVPPIVALYSDPRAWKGRAGLSTAIRSRLDGIFAASPDAILVIFGHPRLVEALDSARHIVCAWGGDEVMQRAAARWLTGRSI